MLGDYLCFVKTIVSTHSHQKNPNIQRFGVEVPRSGETVPFGGSGLEGTRSASAMWICPKVGGLATRAEVLIILMIGYTKMETTLFFGEGNNRAILGDIKNMMCGHRET